MSYRGDERGQAIQIGAVLLLGALVISFSLYQALVVPSQNREVEFKHNQDVQGQLQELRNAFVSTSDGGERQSVSLELGTQYPSRLMALNPGSPSGALSTEGTTNASVNATITNATARGETGDFWTGDDRVFNTGSIVYQPGYNEYAGAPQTVYEHSVLYNQFRDSNLTLTGQRLVDGDEISLVTLNGSYYTSRAESVSVDVRPVSASSTTVSVTNTTDSNVTVRIPTRLGENEWEELLDGEFTSDGGNVVRLETTRIASEEYQLLTLVFERGVAYDLQISRAAIGTNVVRPDATYLTDVEGNGSTVPEGGETEVTVQVRDEFDNPVGNTEVRANTSRAASSVSPSSENSDRAGEVTFTYEAPNDISGVSQATDQINASINVTAAEAADSSFNASTPLNVTISVKIDNSDGSGLGSPGGNDGAYSIDWQSANQTGVNCPGGADGTCIINASQITSVTLTAHTSPTVQNADADFTVGNTSVGIISPTTNQTNSTGETTTEFTVNNNGSVTAFVASGGSGDQLDIKVENVTGGNTAPTAAFTYSPSSPQTNEQIQFNASNSSDPDGSITSYEWDFDDDGATDATGKTATTSYSSSGDYPVTLTVSDGSAVDSTSQTVSVGGISYNNDALSYQSSRSDSARAREGLVLSVTNEFSTPANITSVTITPSNSSIARINDDGGNGYGKNLSELYVDTTIDGYKDIGGSPAGTSLPATIDLTSGDNYVEPQVAGSSTAEFWFYRFFNSDGNEVDVACEEFDITVRTNKSSTDFKATASPPTGDCQTAPSELSLDAPINPQIENSSDTLDVGYSYIEDNPDRMTINFDDGNGNTANYSIDDFGYAGDNSLKSVTLELSNPDIGSFVEGTYDITITATDIGGQSSSVTETDLLTIDNTDPSVTSITRSSPASQDTNASTVDFEVAFSETVSGIGTDDFVLNSNSVSGSITSVNTSSRSNVVVTVESISGDGSLGLDVSSDDITDAAENPLDDTEPTTDETFTIDNTEPTISSADLIDATDSDGAVNESDEIEIAVDTSDALSGIDTVTADASDFGAGTVTLTLNASGIYNTTVGVGSLEPPSADGDYSVSVTATDNAGNSAGATTDTLTLDTASPIINSADLIDATDGDGVVNGSDSIRIAVDASDATSGVGSVTADASDFGAGTAVSLTDGNNNGTFDATVQVGSPLPADGDYSVDVAVDDVADNTQTSTTNVLTIDTTAPSISNVSLDNDGSDNIALSFDSDEALSTITVTVDGPNTNDAYTFDETDFSESGSGPYTYTLDTTQAYDDGTGEYNASVDAAVDSAGNDGGDPSISDTYRLGQTLQLNDPAKVTGKEDLAFRMVNTADQQVTIVNFSVSVTAGKNLRLNHDSAKEVKISRAQTKGFANRDGGGNNDRFEADGTVYGLDQNAVLSGSSDDYLQVNIDDFRESNGDKYLFTNNLEEGTESDNDVIVTFGLDDGTVQEFYFREG